MIQYVAGFLIFRATNEVLLIRKNRPAWQAGRLNGIGGKIEPGETPLEAMRREMREESGLDIGDWQNFAILEGKGRYVVHMFRAFAEEQPAATSLTDETVLWAPISWLHTIPIIPNLAWLVPLALDRDIEGPVHVLDGGAN